MTRRDRVRKLPTAVLHLDTSAPCDPRRALRLIEKRFTIVKSHIFYSWQSDLPNSTNRGFIQNALEGAAEDLKQDEEIVVEPVIDRDTAGVAGSPDIGLTILAKIDAATALVGDVSLITVEDSARPSPNPNVLIELGYAIKALGHGKVVMVMNTAFGGPEKLPFDLRQKRVVTYQLPEGGDKPAARRILRSKLATAIKEILKEHQVAAMNVKAQASSPSDAAIEAIRQGRPDQASAVKSFMAWLADELKKLDPNGLPGETDENLVQAIETTVPLVHDFGRVSEAIAAMRSDDAARAAFKGFEHILGLYTFTPRTGTYRETDFDLFKFVGHELCVTLFAYLLHEERWQTIKLLFAERIYVANGSRGPYQAAYGRLSAPVGLLDRVRKGRLGTREFSIHADILKARHESGSLAKDTPWDEFRATDALLLLRAEGDRGGLAGWWPRTAVYLGSHTPRFLVEATTPAGARVLADLLGETDLAKSRERLEGAIVRLGEGVQQMGSYFFKPFDGFDPSATQTAGDFPCAWRGAVKRVAEAQEGGGGAGQDKGRSSRAPSARFSAEKCRARADAR